MELIIIALIIALAVAIYTMGPWIAVGFVVHMIVNLIKKH